MRYYIAPLDITERQEMIYRAIYKKADFNTMESEYTYSQIIQDIKSIDISEKQLRNDIKKLIELEVLKVVKKGRKGKATIYKITILDKIRALNGQLKGANRTLINEGLQGIEDIKGTNKTVKGQLKGNPIKEKEKEINIYSRVVTRLNDLTGKSYRHTTKKTKTLIDARLKEGFTEEDFYKVIDIKCKEWIGTNMDIYLRPETLFGNKFEGYLNQNMQVAEKPKGKIIDFKIGGE